jgi:hypothetical protein
MTDWTPMSMKIQDGRGGDFQIEIALSIVLDPPGCSVLRDSLKKPPAFSRGRLRFWAHEKPNILFPACNDLCFPLAGSMPAAGLRLAALQAVVVLMSCINVSLILLMPRAYPATLHGRIPDACPLPYGPSRPGIRRITDRLQRSWGQVATSAPPSKPPGL